MFRNTLFAVVLMYALILPPVLVSAEVNCGPFDRIASPIPTPAPVNSVGYAVNSFNWYDLETADGVYNWSLITDQEARTDVNHPLQIFIATGESGDPVSPAVGPAWLLNEGAKVVATKWDRAWGHKMCQQLNEPLPGDPIYQAAFEKFVDAFAAEFAGDPKIAMVGMPPFSGWGFDVGMTGDSSSRGCTQDYRPEWREATGITTEPQWQSYIQGAFDTLWDYEATHWSMFNLTLWAMPARIPNINGGNDQALSISLFQYAAQNQPQSPGQYYCGNESLNTTSGFSNVVTDHCLAFGVTNIAAQTKILGKYHNSCAQMLEAATNRKYNPGIHFIQIYNNEFSSCPNEVAQIATYIAGTCTNSSN
jgi:hypothetical protein